MTNTTLYLRICHHYKCRNLFITKANNGKFCSPECYRLDKNEFYDPAYYRRHRTEIAGTRRPKYKKFEVNKLEKIKRTCLRCNSSFLAKGRFNRLCYKCNDRINRFNLVNDDIYGGLKL